MAPYQPRHGALSSEPESGPSRRRVIAVRTTLGVVLVGAALAISAVFVNGTGPKTPSAGGPHHARTAPGSSSNNPGGHSQSNGDHGRGPGTSTVGNGDHTSTSSVTPSTTGAAHKQTGTTTKAHTGAGTSGASAGHSHTGSTPPGQGTSPGTGGPGTTLTTNPATSSTRALAMVTPAGFGPLLRSAWVAADPGHVGLTAADVQSTYPGSVYYAGQPSLGQYWSLSRFVPSAAAEALSGTTTGKALLSEFATDAVFFKAPGQSWSYVGQFAPGGCPSDVPGTVLASWGICSPVGS